MRKTSLETFRKLIASRSLGRTYEVVIENLIRCRGLTAKEICKKAGRDGLWKRLSELKRLGLVEEVGVRKCSVTERPALVWRLAKKPPSKSVKLVDKKNKWFIVLAAKAKQATAFKDVKKAEQFASARGFAVIEAVEKKQKCS